MLESQEVARRESLATPPPAPTVQNALAVQSAPVAPAVQSASVAAPSPTPTPVTPAPAQPARDNVPPPPAQQAVTVTPAPAPTPVSVPSVQLAAVVTPMSPVLRAAAPPKNPVRAEPTPTGADANYFYRKGRQFADQENFAGALTLYNQAIQLDPNHALALNSRCYANLRLRQYQPALADCDAAIRIKSDYVNAYRNRAVAKHFLGNEPA